MNTFKRLAVSAIVAAMLAACGGSAEKSLASAREHLAKQDHKAAIIEVKNALQQKPDSAEARVLLATALLETGDAVNAELELRKALDLKTSPELVVPKLASAMAATRQFKKMAEEFGATRLNDPKAHAELQVNLAGAQAALGKADLVQKHLAAALEVDPGYEPALIVQARQVAGNKDFDGALAMVDKIIAKNPKSGEGWRLKADIQNHIKRSPDEAAQSYRKALEAKPDLVAAHTSLVTLLLAQGKLDDAAAQLGAFRKVAPNSLPARYLQAQLAYQKRDFKAAREQAQVLLRVASA
ncbi:MAG: system TPR-repeat protein PrsT, partial [Pseudomonadota bacterium]